jgi:hypothetical protein
MNRRRMNVWLYIGTAAVAALVAVWGTTRPASAHVGALTIDSATVSPNGTQVTVNGRLQCSNSETANLNLVVAQPRGRVIAFANGSIGPLSCNGLVQTWTAIVTTSSGSPTFKPGPAVVDVTASTSDNDFAEVRVVVNLQR